MMIGYEGYIDNDADGFRGTIEDCKNEHTKNEYSINTINNNLVYEKNNNTKYAKSWHGHFDTHHDYTHNKHCDNPW